MFRPENFDETVFINQQGETNWDKRCYSFDYMMDVLDEMLEEKYIPVEKKLISWPREVLFQNLT